MSKSSLLDLIDEKIAEAPKPSTRAAINKANAKKSTGPKTKAGKAASAANSFKHGFFSSVQRLDPADAPTFQNLLADFRQSMRPDGPIEDLCCRELAMLQARLQRLESIEFALMMGNIETKPATPKTMYLKDEYNDDAPLDYAFDPRDLAQSFIASADALHRLHKIETHLRRFYNRTFDRLQRDRLRPPNSGPRPSDHRPDRPLRDHPNDFFEHERTGESVVRDREEPQHIGESLERHQADRPGNSVVRDEQAMLPERTHRPPSPEEQTASPNARAQFRSWSPQSSLAATSASRRMEDTTSDGGIHWRSFAQRIEVI